MNIPDSVTREQDRDTYHSVNLARGAIKQVAESVADLRQLTIDIKAGNSETVANITLAYRHLEDASMRLGKALQSLDGGVSVYDKATTVGARELSAKDAEKFLERPVNRTPEGAGIFADQEEAAEAFGRQVAEEFVKSTLALEGEPVFPGNTETQGDGSRESQHSAEDGENGG